MESDRRWVANIIYSATDLAPEPARRVAEDILNALRERGWAPLEDIGIVIAAAGGTLDIPDRVIADPPKTVTRLDRPRPGIAYRIIVR